MAITIKTMTAEENYVFNTKRPIPANMKLAYKDGNPENTRFANLQLVKKTEADIKPAAEPIEDQPKKKAKKK